MSEYVVYGRKPYSCVPKPYSCVQKTQSCVRKQIVLHAKHIVACGFSADIIKLCAENI